MGVNAVAVLDTMWDWRSMTTGAGYGAQAPRSYTINPENKSGKRLYQLLGDKKFVVTNACPQLVGGPNEKGTPDPNWLHDNISDLYQRYKYKLLLVCGKVAWETYQRCGYRPKARVIRMKHPAARNWTRTEIQQWQRSLAQ